MELETVLRLAVDGASRAAGVANLPRAVADVTSAVKSASSAATQVDKAAALLSAGAPLTGSSSKTVQRAAGLLTLAAKDLTGSSNNLLQAAGSALAASNSKLKQALGYSLSAYARLPKGARDIAMRVGGIPTLVQSFGMSSAVGLDMSGVPAQGFLLELAPELGVPFRFALGRAAFDTLSRATQFNIASQERLTRRSAEQAVSKGSDRITLKGAIFLARHGAGHIDRLRELGDAQQPLTLTTGYGEHLGRWYLAQVNEEQAYLFVDGAPRKQTFTLELSRYGEDYQNI